MSKQRVVKDEVWYDEWFYELEPEYKLVWLFLLTNPKSNIAGVYQLNRVFASDCLKINREKLDGAIAYIKATGKILTTGDWIVVKNFHKHQSSNPKVEQGVARILASLPREVFKMIDLYSLSIAYPTLLNSTLLNLSVEEREKFSNLKEKKTMSGFNKYSDDYLEGELQIDPDHKPAKKQTKNVSDDVQAVFDLFDNPAKVTWRLREIERVAAQALFDTYGIEKLKVRIERIKKEKKKADPFFPHADTPSQLLDKMPNIERYLNI